MPKRKEMPAAGGEVPAENPYYAAVAAKLSRLRYCLLALLVFITVLTLWAYRDRITYDNLRYLFRDVDEAASTSVTADAIYYTASETNVWLDFRGDLAVVSADGVALRRSLGGRPFEDRISFRKPVAKASEKYLIAYDVGGNAVYLYNSVNRVFDTTFTTPVVDAAAAKNGRFAVLTREKTGDYLITLYTRSFKRRAAITRAGYVYAVGFLGEKLYFFECTADTDGVYTEVFFYDDDEKDVRPAFRADGLVLSFGAFGKGTYLLTDRALHFFGADEMETGVTPLGTAEVLCAAAGKDAVAVCAAENQTDAACGVYVFPVRGEPFHTAVPKGVKDIAVLGEKTVLLYDGALLAVREGTSAQTEIPVGGRKLLPVGGKDILVCFDDHAKVFSVQ